MSSFVISTCKFSLTCLWHSKTLWLFHSFSPVSLTENCTSVICILPDFTQNLMLIHYSKNWSLNCNEAQKHTHHINATTSTQLVLMHWNHNWCKLKHAWTCFYYDQVAWLPLTHAIKSFWELHSPTTHTCACMPACICGSLFERHGSSWQQAVFSPITSVMQSIYMYKQPTNCGLYTEDNFMELQLSTVLLSNWAEEESTGRINWLCTTYR
jgi:hypothetical protein